MLKQYEGEIVQKNLAFDQKKGGAVAQLRVKWEDEKRNSYYLLWNCFMRHLENQDCLERLVKQYNYKLSVGKPVKVITDNVMLYGICHPTADKFFTTGTEMTKEYDAKEMETYVNEHF